MTRIFADLLTTEEEVKVLPDKLKVGWQIWALLFFKDGC